MIGMQKVGEFMRDDVFDAGQGSFDQTCVEAQHPFLWLTATPARGHFSETKFGKFLAVLLKFWVDAFANRNENFFAITLHPLLYRSFFQFEIVGVFDGQGNVRSVVFDRIAITSINVQDTVASEDTNALSVDVLLRFRDAVGDGCIMIQCFKDEIGF